MQVVLCLLLTGQSALAQSPGEAAAAPSDTLAEKIWLRAIRISGNRQTRRAILLRELSVRPGQLLTRDSMAFYTDQNRLRLVNLPLFTTVSVQARRVSYDSIDLDIAVRERWYIWPEVSLKLADRNFNVWWEEQNHDIHRANISLSLTHSNFRGNLEQLSATLQVGYTRRYALKYSRPYVDRAQKHGFGFSVALAESNEMSVRTDSNKLVFARLPYGRYIQQQYEYDLMYTYRPGYAARHLVQLGYRDYRISDTVLELNAGYFNRGARRARYLDLQYRYEYNGVDNWNYPLRGWKLVNYVSVKAGWEGFRWMAYDQVEAGLFKMPKKRWYGTIIFRGRLLAPGDLGYFMRGAMGRGNEYLRGYEYYVIDGSHYALTRFTAKRELINTTLRFPFKYLPAIPIRIYPKVYTDVGWCRNRYPGTSFLNDRPLYSAGFGIDLVTAYDTKLRIEYTINHLGQKGLFLHLNTE